MNSVAWNFIKNALTSTLDQLALKVVKEIRGKPCQWLTSDVKHNINTRDAILRR